MMDTMHLWNGIQRNSIVRIRRESFIKIMVTRPKLTGGVAITVEQAIVSLLFLFTLKINSSIFAS